MKKIYIRNGNNIKDYNLDKLIRSISYILHRKSE